MINRLIKHNAIHIIAILSFLVIAAIYFSPQLQGKKLRQGDIVEHRYKSAEARQFSDTYGEETLWTNAMFGGSPTYQMSSPQKHNYFRVVFTLLMGFMNSPMGFIFCAMFCFYLMLLSFGIKPLVSIIGALGYGLTTNSMILLEAGHNNKIAVLSVAPLLVGGIYSLFRKKYEMGFVLTCLGAGVAAYKNHPQMLYYLSFSFLILGVIYLVRIIRAKEYLHLGKVAGITVICGILSLGAYSSKILPTMEYMPFSQRGGKILPTQEGQNAEGEEGTFGLGWEYAMGWSNGGLDVVSTLIPGVVGGSSNELIDKGGKLASDLRRKGVNVSADFRAPLYWGALPFTSGPPYFGALIFLLFVMGLFLARKDLKWWIGLSVLLTVLISMGKHFEVLNRPLFEFFPMFDNFRAPNSILGVTALLLAGISFATLHRILLRKDRDDKVRKALIYSLAITGIIPLFFLLLGPGMFDLAGPRDAQLGQAGWSLEALRAERASLMRSDSLRTLLFLVLGAGAVFGFLKKKISANVFLGLIAVLVVIDLFVVDKRYLNDENFQTPRNYSGELAPRQVDEQIMSMEENRGMYRVLDLSINTFNSAAGAQFHNMIGGNDAIKMQRYQDLIDYHISRGNQQVLNMLNTKYIIDQNGKLQVNNQANGPVWFVSEVLPVQSPMEEISQLSSFDSKRQAVVLTKEFPGYLDGFQPPSRGNIQLQIYRPNHLTYAVNAPEEALAVFSEIWYGPDKGWEAFIDGEPAEFIRANYVLRALRIPAGTETVEFRFHPKTYYRADTISLICSSIGILAVLVLLGLRIYRIIGKEVEKSEIKEPVKKVGPKKSNPGKKKRKKK